MTGSWERELVMLMHINILAENENAINYQVNRPRICNPSDHLTQVI